MDTMGLSAKLEEEKVRLEREMRSVGRPTPGVPGDWEPVPSETGSEPDLVDQADITISSEENAAILADLEARYEHVRSALGRIEAGTYGVCETCGKKIEKERLEADPAAASCKAHR
ncbi:MAG: TraR/DksA C4-type zinc finger protein [bacterium]|nr:TraR/DksA C4-type zinc finger protein [bacterium]